MLSVVGRSVSQTGKQVGNLYANVSSAKMVSTLNFG
ncbi:hypothetical protein CLV42_105350 [Chitinophaga ginsengisoli]|uniref:Uncharacterized protein n=1 Tax=Chitinophaga ginsengisoli TaxID=363837 RepID=A0A2P8GAH4_9BACT|nr:hypothetical protein CLV42_105350 [Chitinophaga ginsengisoli]